MRNFAATAVAQPHVLAWTASEVASLTRSSWNQPLEWLLEVEGLRESLGGAPETALPAP